MQVLADCDQATLTLLWETFHAVWYLPTRHLFQIFHLLWISLPNRFYFVNRLLEVWTRAAHAAAVVSAVPWLEAAPIPVGDTVLPRPPVAWRARVHVDSHPGALGS